MTQPQYVHRYGDEFARALGERSQRMTPLGEFRDQGVPVVLSSDAPVCPPLPLEAVYAATTRLTLSGAFQAEDAAPLTVEEALIGHTRVAAASIRRDGTVGSIQPGLLADLVVLSADPTAVGTEELRGISVRQTWSDGKIVYAAPKKA